MTLRVTGLDLSLTGTGVARITATAGDPLLTPPLVHTTRFSTDGAGMHLDARSRRLRTLASWVFPWCEDADLVLVEQPAFGAAGGAVVDRAGLFWLVMGRLTAKGIPCCEVNIAHLKMYASGRGTKVSKDQILSECVRRYADLVPGLESNDEADALVVAAMGWHRLTGAPLVSLPQTHTRAISSVLWPALNRKET